MEYVSTQARLRKVHWLFPYRHHAFVARGKVLNNFPSFIHATGVERVYRVGPRKSMTQTLSDHVRLVADWKETMKLHCTGFTPTANSCRRLITTASSQNKKGVAPNFVKRNNFGCQAEVITRHS